VPCELWAPVFGPSMVNRQGERRRWETTLEGTIEGNWGINGFSEKERAMVMVGLNVLVPLWQETGNPKTNIKTLAAHDGRQRKIRNSSPPARHVSGKPSAIQPFWKGGTDGLFCWLGSPTTRDLSLMEAFNWTKCSPECKGCPCFPVSLAFNQMCRQ
jgi:hypothetical protein